MLCGKCGYWKSTVADKTGKEHRIGAFGLGGEKYIFLGICKVRTELRYTREDQECDIPRHIEGGNICAKTGTSTS